MDDVSSGRSSVHLALPVQVEASQLFSLERHYLPLGKCGGFPAWLNPANLPPTAELTCRNCGSPMAFLLQLYCPSEPAYAFHRVLYVFVCRKGLCAKTNDASNFAVFRCQLPRENPFYHPTGTPNPATDGEVPDPFFDSETYARLCVVCGCHATKRCARCAQRWYCSRDHQIIDWNSVHKGHCLSREMLEHSQGAIDSLAQTTSCAEKAEQCAKQGFTLKEYGIELCSEETEDDGKSEENDESKDDDEEEEADEAEENGWTEVDAQQASLKEADRQWLKRYQKLAEANGVTARDLEGLEESRRDRAFLRFNAMLNRFPEQIVRYQRGGEPLPATDHSPLPSSVPDCELCGAVRHFEFQLMPYLVALMELDEEGQQSLDWATLMIHTCSASCRIAADGYAREFAFKQDFVSPSENKM